MSPLSRNHVIRILHASLRSVFYQHSPLGYLPDFHFSLGWDTTPFPFMMLSMENFPQTENTASHNIRTLFIVVMWSILMRILYFFTIGSQGFGLVNAYSHTNFLQYLENFALWSTSMSLGHVGSHLAWLARAWVLGQFLAYLEIFSEGRMELLRLQSDLHNDLAPLQNEGIILFLK